MVSANTDGAVYLTVLSMVATLVIMMAGFALLEAGSVRSKNASSIVLKNLFNATLGTVAFFLLGAGISLGESWNGIIGTSNFLFLDISFDQDTENSSTSLAVSTFTVLLFSLTASTILSGAIAERAAIMGYIVWLFFSNLLFYPLISHWAYAGWLGDFGFVDVAGSGTVHVYGGVSCLVGIYLIGPRIGRQEDHSSAFRKDLGNLIGHSVVLASLGAILLFFGFFGFNGSSSLLLALTLENDNAAYYYYATCSLNTLLGAAGGSLCTMALTFATEKRWSVIEANMGLLSGCISVCAGVGFMPSYAALLGGILAGFSYHGMKLALIKLKLDDSVNAAPVHLGSGAVGLLICALFYNDPVGDNNGVLQGGNGSLLYKQLVGFVVIAVFSAFTTFLVLYPFKYYGLIRASENLESNGFDKNYMKEPAYPEIYAKGDFILFREYLHTNLQFKKYKEDSKKFNAWNSKANINSASYLDIQVCGSSTGGGKNYQSQNSRTSSMKAGDFVVEGLSCSNFTAAVGSQNGESTIPSNHNSHHNSYESQVSQISDFEQPDNIVVECADPEMMQLKRLQKVDTGMDPQKN
eukprot:Awhi_evm1s14849